MENDKPFLSKFNMTSLLVIFNMETQPLFAEDIFQVIGCCTVILILQKIDYLKII
jgi:hypothetical protein